MFRRSLISAVLAVGVLAPAAADEVHFGGHVFIGGHDVSHQTFNRHRRAVYYLYRSQPHPAGCVWRRNDDGSQTKVCRLKLLH